jgi:hypothetical protein
MITEIDFEVLQKLRQQDLFTDITLIAPSANNAEYKMHKIILAASSKYFHDILTKDPKIDKLTLPNPIIPIFSKSSNLQGTYQAVLDALYSNKNVNELVNHGLSADNCFTYYSIVNSLHLEMMKNNMIDYISNNVLNQANISAILTDSTKMQIPNLVEKCTSHLLQDFGSVLNSKEQSQQLLQLPYDDFLKMISRDDMLVDSEDSIFDLVIKYIDLREKSASNPAPPPPVVHNTDPGNPPQAAPNPAPPGPVPAPAPAPAPEPPLPLPVPPAPAAGGPQPPAAQPGASPNSFDLLDLAKLAEDIMKIVVLTDDQKKNLLLALRFKFISHDKLMKESKNPLLEKFKDILMEGLSAKLKNYEPSSQVFQINTNPRKYYGIDSNMVGGLDGMIQSYGKRETAGMGGATQKLLQSTLGGHQKGPNMQHHMNNIGHNGKNVFSMLGPSGQNQQGSRQLADSHNYQLPPGFTDSAPYQGQDHYALQNGFGSKPVNDQERRLKPDNFGKRDMGGFGQQGLKNHNYASTAAGSGAGMSPIPLPVPQMQNSGLNHHSRPGFNDNYNYEGMNSQDNDDDTIFTYRYDFDENGALYHLGTRGRTAEYTNPYTRGEVKVYFSSMGKGSYEDLVGRALVNCRTLNEPNAFMGIDLSEGRYLVPSCYTIRNRDSSRHIMLNWLFEGSVDFKTWYILDKRIHKTDDQSYNKIMEKERQMIERRGATSTWSVDQNYLKVASRSVVMQSRTFSGFRFFRIKQISKNSSGADNLALSGFEIYGIAKGNNWRFF